MRFIANCPTRPQNRLWMWISQHPERGAPSPGPIYVPIDKAGRAVDYWNNACYKRYKAYPAWPYSKRSVGSAQPRCGCYECVLTMMAGTMAHLPHTTGPNVSIFLGQYRSYWICGMLTVEKPEGKEAKKVDCLFLGSKMK